MEYILCKSQYVGKAEKEFNLSLNNHRKDTKNANSIPACKHFHQQTCEIHQITLKKQKDSVATMKTTEK